MKCMGVNCVNQAEEGSGICSQCEKLLGEVFPKDQPSQLDRIEKRQTDDYQGLDTRLTQLVLNEGAAAQTMERIESKLDKILDKLEQAPTSDISS